MPEYFSSLWWYRYMRFFWDWRVFNPPFALERHLQSRNDAGQGAFSPEYELFAQWGKLRGLAIQIGMLVLNQWYPVNHLPVLLVVPVPDSLTYR